MKSFIHKILKFIKELFTLRCPYCGGVMKSEFLDMEFDRMVYKCTECEREWI